MPEQGTCTRVHSCPAKKEARLKARFMATKPIWPGRVEGCMMKGSWGPTQHEEGAVCRTEGLGLSLLREQWARNWVGQSWVPEILCSQTGPLKPQSTNPWEGNMCPSPTCRIANSEEPGSRTPCQGHIHREKKENHPKSPLWTYIKCWSSLGTENIRAERLDIGTVRGTHCLVQP